MGNRTTSLIIAAALGLSVAAVSQAASPGARVFPVGEQPSLVDRFPNPPIAFPGGVKAYRDVVYHTVDGYRPQIVDIYVPAGKGPHPLVLYIHGGGWRGGHTRHSGALADFPKVLASLAAEGFTVASLEYRLSSEAQFPAQLQDSNAALRFLRANAARRRVGRLGRGALDCTDRTNLPRHQTGPCIRQRWLRASGGHLVRGV